MKRGALLAKGRTAEVYFWGDTQVLKLFYDWCPRNWIQRETDVAQTISQTDIPAPKCFGTVTVDNRTGIVFQKVQGPSLLSLMTSNPVRISSYARLMADLHIQMHKNDARTLLPLRSWLTRCIQEAEALPSDLRDFARSILQELPDGKALCHFDFHPGQIIMSKEGPIVLDWMTAFQGDPLADVARTSILLTMSRTDHLKWLTRVMVGVGRRQMHRAYRKQYLRR